MMERIRVLIADDDALVREGTRHILEREDDLAVVGEAADGEEAVALIETLRPDVAIVDVGMPRMSGVDVTRRVKADHPDLPILVLTVHDDDAYVYAILQAGAAGYLLKDVHGSELIRAIRSVCAGEPVLHPAITRKVLSRFRHAGQAAEDHSPLTERELDVLRLAARGLSNKEIASKLDLSARTVQAHLGRTFQKLRVASRTEAVIHGLRSGWFDLEDLT